MIGNTDVKEENALCEVRFLRGHLCPFVFPDFPMRIIQNFNKGGKFSWHGFPEARRLSYFGPGWMGRNAITSRSIVSIGEVEAG